MMKWALSVRGGADLERHEGVLPDAPGCGRLQAFAGDFRDVAEDVVAGADDGGGSIEHDLHAVTGASLALSRSSESALRVCDPEEVQPALF
jgi:hypothetical protein